MFAAQLRAPLYEDKVVDFLFAKADISDRKATREQLEADLESEEGHVHGPGCGHDHAAREAEGEEGCRQEGQGRPRLRGRGEGADQAEAKAPADRRRRPTASKRRQPKPAKPMKSEPANKAAAKAEKAPSQEGRSQEAEAKPAAKPKKASARRLERARARLRGPRAAIDDLKRDGFRLDVIYPADDPQRPCSARAANGPADQPAGRAAASDALPPFEPEFVLTRAGASPGEGRAGMLYRDLIPGRLGGRYIASHITIPERRPGRRLGPFPPHRVADDLRPARLGARGL